MNKRKLEIVYGIIILLVLGIVLYFSLRKNIDDILNIISNISIWWIILAVILFIGYRFMVGLSICFLTLNSNEKISLLKGLQLSFIIVLFNGITPFASGGQPMSVYYLHKEKISYAKSTNIILQNFIMYQTALILVGIVTILYNYFFPLFAINDFMRRILLLGFLINFSVWIVTFMLAFGKKSVTIFLKKIIMILYKIKLIKNINKHLNKIDELSSKFYSGASNLIDNKKIIFLEIIINIIGLLLLYSIPYVLACGLNINDYNLIHYIVCISYVMIVGSFVPTPGGTGGIEYSFLYFFGFLIKGNILSALMLVWRFITYYGAMIMGALFVMLYRKKNRYD